VAEGGGLLNRYTALKLYPGFKSLPLRQTTSYNSRASKRLRLAGQNAVKNAGQVRDFVWRARIRYI
jgi:hypothetical protein